MSEIAQGRNVRVEVGITEGTAKVVSAVTKADPGVVSSTAHGLANGSVGYFDTIVGMDELEGQPARVDDQATDAFDAEGVDTTGFETFVSGNFIPVTAWSTLSQSVDYSLTAGAGTREDRTCLIDKKDKDQLITQGVESCTMNLRALTEDNVALAYIRAKSKNLDYVVFRITLHDGAQRIFRGQPAKPGESLAAKGLGTGTLEVAGITGDVLYLPAL